MPDDPVATAAQVLPACTGKCAPKHLPCVVSTRRLLRRQYWVRCWACDLRFGPFPDRVPATSLAAMAMVRAMEVMEVHTRHLDPA